MAFQMNIYYTKLSFSCKLENCFILLEHIKYIALEKFPNNILLLHTYKHNLIYIINWEYFIP